MRTLKWILLATVMSTGTAFAADLAPQPVEPAAPVYLPFSWTGFYVGAQVGYAWGNADHSVLAGTGTGSSDPDGVVGGVFAGYNYDFHPFVVGVEADVEASRAEGDFFNPAGASLAGSTDLNWQGSLRARVGYSFDRALIYATAGAAYGNFDFQGGPIPATQGEFSKDLWGWTAGAGVEYAFTDNIIARLEYRYTDFGSTSGVIAPFPVSMTVKDAQFSTVRVGISYKF